MMPASFFHSKPRENRGGKRNSKPPWWVEKYDPKWFDNAKPLHCSQCGVIVWFNEQRVAHIRIDSGTYCYKCWYGSEVRTDWLATGKVA